MKIGQGCQVSNLHFDIVLLQQDQKTWLNESEHSVYTEVHLQDDMESNDTAVPKRVLNSNSVIDGEPVIFQTEQPNLSSFVEPTEVLYAVEY